MKIKESWLYNFFVKNIYGDHNSTKAVNKKIKELITPLLNKKHRIINVGSGNSRIHKDVVNIDIFEGENIDHIATADDLPFKDNSIDLIINQEVLEHTPEPIAVIEEFRRVLKPKGKVYCQVPFIIGFHPSPDDYWRFTYSGLKLIFEQKQFKVLEINESVGSATGFYRIAVEFFAIFISLLHNRLYLYGKGFFSLLFYPIKFFDAIIRKSSNSKRISGGYYLIAEK